MEIELIVLILSSWIRWKKNENGEWIAVMKSHLWFLSQDETCLSFRAIPDVSQEFGEEFIKDYFQWDVNLGKLYADWTRADEKFADIAADYKGVRILRQDPVENVFSFICSSNNNIQRYFKFNCSYSII